MTEKKPTLTIVAGREGSKPRCRLPRAKARPAIQDRGPEALGWQKITNDWRERARAETFVRLSACLHEVRKSLSSHSHNSCKTMAQEFGAQTKTNMCRDSEARRYVGRERAYETHVRARRAQPSSTLWQRLNVIMTKWRGLIQIARNPYRPELYYMRGPGPKSYAKHQGRIENGPL